jgi:hypothetical protein
MPSALDRLPLFATDDEIAIAIVGKKRASEWKRGALQILEARGFPRFDALHGGRPVPLIRKWYELHMGLHLSCVRATLEDAKEKPEVWTRSKRDRRNDRKPQFDLDGRSRQALLYMVAHPDARTHPAIPNAGAFTMDKLAEKGAIVAGKKDRDGDIMWKVTELGREEAKRIDFWHHGKTT